MLLRHKLYASLVFAILFPLSVSTYMFSSNINTHSTENLMQSELPTALSDVRNAIELELAEPIITSQSIAKNSFVNNWLKDGEAESQQSDFVSYLAEIKGQSNAITAFIVSGTSENYYTHAGLVRQINKSSDPWFYDFIDSNKVDMATLPSTFLENQIDYVIGPLLKKHVHSYLNILNNELPTLLLNISSDVPMQPNHVALSMRREDEAIQAATTLSKQDFKHPIVFSLNDNVSQRIAKSFTQQWFMTANIQPEIVYFDRNADMQKLLKKSLDVSESQKRIKNIELRLRQNIKTESRNRRDLDMIYLVASPTATRLLKPYIDVNISTYASLIPIFASSLSHSGKVDASERKDLDGLSFTEMPWLLSSKYQNRPLQQLSHKLWPERSDSLQRIFAMGFDSYNLVKKIPAMKAEPYIRHFGQTGVLKLDAQNILTRSLLWGKYDQGEVQEIVMD